MELVNYLLLRKLAANLLNKVFSLKAPLDQSLEEFLKTNSNLSSVQRAWLYEVCSGVTRWKGVIDFVIDSLAKKKKPSGVTRRYLSIAIYQIIAQEKTSSAKVIDETVELMKQEHGVESSRFINAVLRNFLRDFDFWKKDFEEKSLPKWLWIKLKEQQGEEWVKNFACASLNRPENWLRSHPSFNGDEFKSQVESGPFEFCWKVTQKGEIKKISGYQDKKFFVQDISNQKLVKDVTQIIVDNNLERKALDLCASPGGKSLGLAWNQFKVVATDKKSNRFNKLHEITSYSSPGEIVVASFEDIISDTAQFPLVWVDAPCSGVGIIRRHPEIRWFRTPKEVQQLVKIQSELVNMAWKKVCPGGVFVYSVCSVLNEEGKNLIQNNLGNEEVIKEWFLSPQDIDQGDGFWACAVKKQTSSQ